MDVHLVDGTYELFRYHFSPGNKDPAGGRPRRGALVPELLEQGATHVGVATDHVIESFRNDLWPGYKVGRGCPASSWPSSPSSRTRCGAAGFTVWPMVEQEADDALAAAAAVAAADDRGRAGGDLHARTRTSGSASSRQGVAVGPPPGQVVRRRRACTSASACRPASVPDLLALVGDAADGFPGLPGWGAKSAAAVLDRWGHLEDIPADPLTWDAGVRGAAKLNATLREQCERGAALPPDRHRRARLRRRRRSTTGSGPVPPMSTGWPRSAAMRSPTRATHWRASPPASVTGPRPDGPERHGPVGPSRMVSGSTR